jgi:signal transduction histidine kinase/CheY-like chemotaxis protein
MGICTAYVKRYALLPVIYWCFGVLGIYLYGVTAVASERLPAMMLADGQTTVSAAPFMEIFEDPTRRLTLAQVMSPAFSAQFVVNTQENLNVGRTRSAYWVRFKLIDQSVMKWYLLADAMLDDQFDLYVLMGNGEVTTRYAQTLEPYRRRAWSLDLPRHEPVQVYIRATNGDSILNIPVELLTADTMLKRSNGDYRFFSGIFSAMLMMAAYNLFLFFVLREFSYLMLVVHTLGMIMVMHANNPVFETLTLFHNTGSHFFTTPVYIVIITLSLFVRELLKTAHCVPAYDRALRALVWLAVILMPVTGWISAGTLWLALFALLGLLLIFATSVAVARQGDRIALYFLGIFLLILSFAVPNLLMLMFREQEWHVHGSYSSMMALGHVIFILLLSVVQAERVRLLREQMQRTVTANQSRGEFLATMSHELRTPMNAIAGLTTLLGLTRLDRQQQEYVDKLGLSSRHMAQLVGDVLDLARIDRKNFQLDYAPFQFSLMIQQIHALLTQKAARGGLQLIFTGVDGMAETLLGDRIRLSQILINLLDNAIKYTPTGTVTLSVERLAPRADGQLALRFEVSDTGSGIPPDKLATVFENFSQLHTDPHALREGVGLGLAICKRLVEMMGGKLEVASTLGQGSQFFFTLLFKTTRMGVTDGRNLLDLPPLTGCRLPEGIRILLVDDDEINRFVGQKLLQRLGGNVTLAVDGKSAILQLQQDSFDVVLLDISMPDISGFEVLHWIRHSAPNPKVLVITLTAHATQDVQQQCHEAGADAFLSKPFTYQDLSALICRTLKHCQYCNYCLH